MLVRFQPTTVALGTLLAEKGNKLNGAATVLQVVPVNKNTYPDFEHLLSH